MFKNFLRGIEKRLNIKPMLDVLKKTRPARYLYITDAPPISPGRLALFLVGILILSGLGLTLFYNPTTDRAASSLAFLHSEQPLGWLLHNTHRWSALLIVIFMSLHILRVLVTRAHQYPRDINWGVGLFLFILVIFLGGTGYLLRWDIKAFVLMDLVISNFSNIPILGPLITQIILGGSELEIVPLYRGYVLHVWFLPVMLILASAIHILIVWRQGLAELPDLWLKYMERFPFRKWQQWAPGLVLLFVLFILSAITPHAGQSGPTDRSIWPHPDWLLMFYILPFWFFKGKWRIVGSLIVPLVLIIFLIRAPEISRRTSKRIIAVLLSGVSVLGVIWLFGQISYMGYQVPLQGCNACHRPTIIGDAPTRLSDFDIRDPDWVIFHLVDPQGSLFVPFSEPGQTP